MKNPNLQLMVHGKDIAGSSVTLSYEGITLKSVTRLNSPNFLFLDLYLEADVRPGTFELEFSRNGKTSFSHTYELMEREKGSAMREGFNNSDVMYLIMPDRFANGNPANDEFDDMPDKLARNQPYGRHGGDIQGIIDHLDYLQEMGFTAIWLNPVLENDQKSSSYHGYAATDFYRVDRRFGSNEEYRKLSELARERGIKMIMDMIFKQFPDHREDLPTNDLTPD